MRTVIKTYKFKLYNSKKNKHLSNAGTAVVKIDRWVPSSKACHICGTQYRADAQAA